MKTSLQNTKNEQASDVDKAFGEKGNAEDDQISRLEADLTKEKAKRRQEKFIFSAVWISAPSMVALTFCKIWFAALLVGILAFILLMASARRCEQKWAVLMLDGLLDWIRDFKF